MAPRAARRRELTLYTAAGDEPPTPLGLTLLGAWNAPASDVAQKVRDADDAARLRLL